MYMRQSDKSIIKEMIEDLTSELAAAELNLDASQKVLMAARQNIVRLKVKISKLEMLLQNRV
jgi:hypothetical protein